MSDHIVDQIADRFVDLLIGETDALDRVYRDQSEQFAAFEDLPAIDIRIGEDDPQDGSANGSQDSEVRINVDLYTINRSGTVSADLLEMRKQTYKLLMVGAPGFGMAPVIGITAGGAEEVRTSTDTVPLGYLRTVYFIKYRHQLTDPSQ